MPNLQESPVWVDGIYQITTETAVLGKDSRVAGDGPSNIQAKQLADRTRFLKQSLESIPDYREYTFLPTITDPDGTKAGVTNTPNGKIFRVAIYAGSSNDYAFKYYLNDNGAAQLINQIPSSGALNKLSIYLGDYIQKIYLTLHIVNETLNELDFVGESTNQEFQRFQSGIYLLAEALNEVSDVPEVMAGSQLNLLRILSLMGERLAPLDGFDPQNVVSDDTVAQAVENYSTSKRQDGQYFLPDPVNSGLIRIDVSVPSIPASKTDPDVNGTVRIIVGGATMKTNCAFSVQGATSAAYPKKNFNIELFSDDTHSDNIEVKLGELLPHDKLVFKSNWIDATHARNAMSYNLWRKIVNSRTSWPKNEVDTPLTGIYGVKSSFSGANGHPTLFPAVLYINNEFYGIGSFGTAKKYKNYNLEKNRPLQIQLDHGDWTPVNKFVDAVAAGGIEISAPKSPTQATTDALARWDAFAVRVLVGDSSGWENVIDAQNFVDFILLVEFIFAADLISNNNIKNVQMITYDGLKWFFMPYDLDTVYGLSWNGASLDDNATKIYINDNGSFWRNLIAAVGANKFSSRYAELRRMRVFSPDGISENIRYLQSSYSRDLFDAEWAKWPQVPSLSITSPDQIIRWIQSRIQFLDKKYGYSGN